ncbi:hypothetical protein ISO73_16325 [Morganella morganii subsp. morganii]|uniref:hypothetical protein n=1 Tax=Morganella morganii TaxID=582 RepID=UPI0015F42B21|nr:hypothetical protein [Morganella morganii]ELA8474717.1 hypothetical protein [Morganella morganii]MBA5852592.1 hypothetical protein [Morganella morganii]MBT0448383.1 hypothetical protein [Morganella morganii subsp. morganii]MBT0451815.1 hypothetical protein [Morganella morganii subsp. morganii]MBT0510208.1 hypothetical protein [Morganella morganii subsp. morganii]
MDGEISIKITNLSEISAVLYRIKQGEQIGIDQIDLSSLANVKIKAYGDGDQFSGQLTSSICSGLRDFHTELLKVYCIIRYGSDNLRYLKDSEKEALEVIFKIDPGCTQILVEMKEFISACGDAFKKVTEGMNGNLKATCYIATVLTVAGYFAFDNYSDRQTNLEAAQAEASTQIEQQRILKDAVLEALKINGEKPPMIDEIETKASQAYEKALKPLSDADKVEIYSAGKESVLGNKELNEFIANPTPKLETSESTKILEIEGIKRSPEKLTVTCSERGSDISFTLYVDLSFINQTEVDILFDAFKKNKPVSVQGSYKERSGIIERANASTITVYQQN